MARGSRRPGRSGLTINFHSAWPGCVQRTQARASAKLMRSTFTFWPSSRLEHDRPHQIVHQAEDRQFLQHARDRCAFENLHAHCRFQVPDVQFRRPPAPAQLHQLIGLILPAVQQRCHAAHPDEAMLLVKPEG